MRRSPIKHPTGVSRHVVCRFSDRPEENGGIALPDRLLAEQCIGMTESSGQQIIEQAKTDFSFHRHKRCPPITISFS